jgi:hypothetical protein
VAARAPVVTGGPETAAAFDKLRDDVRDLSATHEKVARARLGSVARLTPVRSGALRDSWDAAGSATAGSIMSPLAYAAAQEYGSDRRGISAVRMIARTLEADQVALLEEYDAAILERARARGFRLA